MSEARERWNRRWSERGVAPFERPPARWLSDSRELLGPGHGRRALDVACGDGRNAGFLASLGFEVDAVDVSDVAIDALQRDLGRRGRTIHPLQVNLEREPLPTGPYDVIVQFFYLQRDLFGPIAAALAPEGVVVAETHLRAPDASVKPRYLLDPGELRSAFPGLRVLRQREDPSAGEGPDRAVASIVAQRDP